MYVQLAEELFKGEVEYTCRTAETPKQAIELAEQGFEKFEEFSGLHLYRKIK